MIVPSKDVKHDIRIVLILFLLSCIFFWKILLNPDKVIFAEYFSDVIDYSLPIKTFIQETWQSTGNLPFWNPYTFMGNPAAANPQYTMFHPYNLLYLILQPGLLFGFLFLLDAFLIGVFTYFFARSIGIKKFGALVSAVTFMFSGVVIGHVYGGHPMDMDVIIMMPLSFFAIETAMQKRSIFYGILAGMPIGFQLLGGNTQVALYGISAVGLYFILRLSFTVVKTPKVAPKLMLIMILATLVGISLSAVQLVPSLELSGLASRSDMTYEEATTYSFPPEQSLTFLMPEIFGTYLDYTYWGGRNFWELCVYTGVFSIVLAIVSLIGGVKNQYKIIFSLLLIFSFLFAIGQYFPLYKVFYYFVPFFDIFRKPSVMLFLTAFSIAVLSGFGADFLSGDWSIKRKKTLLPIIKVLTVLSVFTLAVAASVYAFKDTVMSYGEKLLQQKYELFTSQAHSLPYGLDFYVDKIPEVYSHILNSLINLLALSVAITILLYARLKNRIGFKYFQILVLMVILFDLWGFGMKYIDVIDAETIFAKRPVIGLLENETQSFRLLDMSASLPSYVAMKYHIETLDGYDPIHLESYADFMKYHFGENEDMELGYSFLKVKEDRVLNNSKLLGLLNVKYILTQRSSDSPGFSLKQNITTPVYVKSLSNYKYETSRRGYQPSNLTMQVYMYENNDFLPRAFVVRNAEVAGGGKTLEDMAKEDFDPTETIILEKDVGVPLNNQGAYKQADIAYYSPNEIRVQVYMDNPGFLVLSENYYPGWTATDNGRETEIYRADYILRAVYLNEGQHTVKFVYDSVSFRLGSSITIITLLLVCTLILYKIKSNLRRDGAK